MKAYKIRVPSIDVCYDPLSNGTGINVEKKYSRGKIHELIPEHAFSIGYKHYLSIFACEFLLISDKAIDGSWELSDFNKWQAEEIAWQDFLKLTPADVADNVGKQNFIPVDCSGNQDNLTPGEIHIIEQPKNIADERKELAKEFLKILIGTNENKEGSLKMKSYKYNTVKSNVELAFKYADEFIKQGGE